MKLAADRTQATQNLLVANAAKRESEGATFQFKDERLEKKAQQKLQLLANDSPEIKQLAKEQNKINQSIHSQRIVSLKTIAQPKKAFGTQVQAPFNRISNGGVTTQLMSNHLVVQRVLSQDEKNDKLRILCDYVQFTPPNYAPFLNQYGAPPNTKVQYKLKLLEKIRGSAIIIRSLKCKATMVADEEDDNWNEPSFNVTTLIAAIDAIYNNGLQRIDGTRLIGRTDEDFEHHDCVWAAVAYGLGRENTLEEERTIAAEHSSKEGEVEDSILHRIMENLGWAFLGNGTFNEMFPGLQPGIATVDNIKGYYDGCYLISEDVNAGGTQGHVLAVDVLDINDDGAPLGYRRHITFTDRQHERNHHSVARANPPIFQVYVWKVS